MAYEPAISVASTLDVRLPLSHADAGKPHPPVPAYQQASGGKPTAPAPHLNWFLRYRKSTTLSV